MTSSEPIIFDDYLKAEAHLINLGFKWSHRHKNKHLFLKNENEIAVISADEDFCLFTAKIWGFSNSDLNILMDIFGK
jgi:hypothetical protein